MKYTPLGLLAALLLPGCSNVPILPGLMPYKMEIQQGNFITQDMVSRLKPGMTKDQVRFILGTPLVADLFHNERWDYVYTRVPERGGAMEQRRLAVFFEEGKLARLDGDVIPQAGPSSASDDTR
jgi:outer membrane protein assembly factor BamE